MARIELIEDETASEQVAGFYAEMRAWLKPLPGPRAQHAKVPQIWRACAHNTDIARFISGGTRYYLSQWPWGLEHLALRQIIIFTATSRLKCRYGFVGNWPAAEKAGITRAQYEMLENVEAAKASDLFDADQRLVIAYIDELVTRADASDALFDQLVARFGETVAFEITAFAAFRTMTSMLINALRIEDD